MYGDIFGSLDTKANLFTTDFQHDNLDLISDNDALM